MIYYTVENKYRKTEDDAMPLKSVREMSSLEKKHYSLRGRTFRATLLSGVALGLVLLIIGLALYTVSLTKQYINHAFYLSEYAAMAAEKETDTAALADRVMEIYRSLSDEERAKTGSDGYRERFYAAAESESYKALIHMLPAYAVSDDVEYVYIAMYDEDTCAMVYIADPSDEDFMYPGEWEPVTEVGLRKFLDWDGEGMLYDIDRTEKYGWMCTAGTPIKNAEGKTSCFLLVDVSIANVRTGMKAYALQITVAVIAVTSLVAWGLLSHMKKTLVDPINQIAEAAAEYAGDRKNGIRDTDHFSMLNIRTGDEVENLKYVMADMENDLAEYEEDLTRITAEKERIGAELSLASNIQENSVPNSFPAFPDRKDFDIYAAMDPAKEVGGDFYNFFFTDEDHLVLMIGDVSGKGIPAALFMMVTNILLSDKAILGASPSEMLDHANKAICMRNPAEMFVTVWVGILELSTGKLTAANAGHEYPAVMHPGGDFELLKDKHGFVVGGMDDCAYGEYELKLEKGSKLFVYTDGVPEATDKENRLFGTERMLDALNEARDQSPEEILASVRSSVDGFVKDAEQFDDLTMLCIEYKGE